MLYLDSARGLLMLLGIPYHVALIYSPDIPRDIHAADGSLIVQWIGGTIHAFRMPAFFIVAGFCAALALERRADGPAWLLGRCIKLGLPFFAGMVLLNPIQMYASALAQTATPAAAFDAFLVMLQTPGRHWVRHLWFLPVLVMLSAGLAPAWPALRRGRAAIRAFAGPRLRGRAGLAALMVALAAWQILLLLVMRHGDTDLALLEGFVDLRAVLYFAPYFTLGAVLQMTAGLARLPADRWVAALGAAALIAYLSLYPPGTAAVAYLFEAASAFTAVAMFALLIGLCRRHLDRPSRVIGVLVRLSFPIYLIHMPIVSVLGLVMKDAALDPVLGFGIMSLVVLALSTAVAGAALRLRLGQALFNGAVRAVPVRRLAR
nr:acyltransferase family protein [Ancylobacter lacus]